MVKKKDNISNLEQSIYYYTDTNILINKFNIKNKKKLKDIEREIITLKLGDYNEYMIIDVRNPNLLLDLHKFLFEDIYDFAGVFREEEIEKTNFKFMDYKYINDSYYNLINELKKENYLVDLDAETLSERLAYYMSELNIIHPFIRGNGIAIREYIKLLAFNAKYELDWKKEDPKKIFDASVESVRNEATLSKCIFNCLIKIY